MNDCQQANFILDTGTISLIIKKTCAHGKYLTWIEPMSFWSRIFHVIYSASEMVLKSTLCIAFGLVVFYGKIYYHIIKPMKEGAYHRFKNL